MSRFLSKQLRSAEDKPLGRVERTCSYENDRFVEGQARAQSSAKLPLETTMEFPVGRKRGVQRPGGK